MKKVSRRHCLLFLPLQLWQCFSHFQCPHTHSQNEFLFFYFGLYHHSLLPVLVDSPSLFGCCFFLPFYYRGRVNLMSSVHNCPFSLWCIDLGFILWKQRERERDFLETGRENTIFFFWFIDVEDPGELIECITVEVLSSAYLCAEHIFSCILICILCTTHCIPRHILHPEACVISAL